MNYSIKLNFPVLATFFLGLGTHAITLGLRDRSVFIACEGVEDFWGDRLIFRRTKGGSINNDRSLSSRELYQG